MITTPRDRRSVGRLETLSLESQLVVVSLRSPRRGDIYDATRRDAIRFAFAFAPAFAFARAR